MATICDLYKLLENPLRLKMLRLIYDARDGMNVGTLVDEMLNDGIGQSGVSQYLKQLAGLGVIRRVRAGRYVNYVTNHAPNDAIERATEAIIQRLREKGGRDLGRVFGALMNPFRAAVVSALSKIGTIPAVDICEKTGHQIKHLKRDLQTAVDAGLVTPDDADTAVAAYHYVAPRDPLVGLLISLCDHIL